MTDLTEEYEKLAPDYERPDISLIEPDLAPYGVSLFIGGREGTANLALLRDLGITTVVNCAVNFDLNLVQEPDPAADPDSLPWGHGAVRYYKLGLVDGAGNADTMMLAGYFLVRGALDQVLPNRPTYPMRERGNLLVNCRGGRSRSVALVALVLHRTMPGKYPDIDAALAHIRKARDLRPDEWDTAPKPMLVDAARKASDWIDRMGAEEPPEAPSASGAQ